MWCKHGVLHSQRDAVKLSRPVVISASDILESLVSADSAPFSGDECFSGRASHHVTMVKTTEYDFHYGLWMADHPLLLSEELGGKGGGKTRRRKNTDN